jgi:hypothetical protein
MKKIMFTGMLPEVTEEAVRAELEKVGPVINVSIIRDGNPNEPVVIVEMDISDSQAYRLTSRVTDFWHNGHMINARLLLH